VHTEFKLIIKKINNSLSPEEAIAFDQWISESPDHLAYYNKVKANYNKDLDFIDQEKAWQVVEGSLGGRAGIRYWHYAAAAAVVGIFVSILLLRGEFLPSINETSPKVLRSNIKIGSDKAVLTLSDGKELALEQEGSKTLPNASSNGKEIVYHPIPKESDFKTVSFNYLTIPRGGQFFVKLSDGTRIWLNSESKLKYPVAFAKEQPREVELVYGEAYFEVSPSSEHNGAKFKVVTGAQEVEVLGTVFNIRAYKDEMAIYTTLVEGKVTVANGRESRSLTPEKQSIVYDGLKDMELVDADVYSATSWKKGIFSFNGMPLEEIMKVLARWYDIDVIFRDPKLKNSTFNGVLRKNQNIEAILESIKTTNNMDYEINENTVIFK
tara:strand:- start:14177 stop:15316 length:1140 start_codon:yes stop_codon:yes gene_type:complete